MHFCFIEDLASRTIRLLGVRKGEGEHLKKRIGYYQHLNEIQVEEKHVFEIDPQDDAWGEMEGYVKKIGKDEERGRRYQVVSESMRKMECVGSVGMPKYAINSEWK